MKCDTCSKRFASRHDLNRHVASHRVGIAAFRCGVGDCDFTATRKDNLGQHIRNKHANLIAKPPAHSETPGHSTDQNSVGSLDCEAVSNLEESARPQYWPVAMSAARTGDISRLSDLLKYGMDVNITADDGYTALHCAARAGETATVDFLLENGARIDSNNIQMRQRRPLHEAILGKHAAVVKFLLQTGANVSETDGHGSTVADYVGHYGDAETVQAFMQARRQDVDLDDLASKVARCATRYGNSSLLAWLLSTCPSIETYFSEHHKSLLKLAAVKKHLYAFELFFSFSQRKNSFRTEFLKTVSDALPHAAKHGWVAIVERLLQCEGININKRTSHPRHSGDALCYAASNGHLDVVILLLNHPEIRSVKQAAREAVRRGRTQIVRYILEVYQMDLDCTGIQGSCLVLEAVENGQSSIANMILGKHNVPICCKDSNGRSCLGQAFLSLQWEAFRLITEHFNIELPVKFDIMEEEPLNPSEEQVQLLMEYLLENKHMTTESGWEWRNVTEKTVKSNWSKFAEVLLNLPCFASGTLFDPGSPFSALHMTIQYHNSEILNLILNHPNFVLERINYIYSRYTVAHCAVQHYNMTALRMLFAKIDIDLSIHDWKGKTALDLAKQMGRHEMVEFMSKHKWLQTPSEQNATTVTAIPTEEQTTTLATNHTTQQTPLNHSFYDQGIDSHVTHHFPDNEYEEEDMETENWDTETFT